MYVAYRKSGYSKKFLEEHEDDIIIHKAAKKAFDELGVKKLPTIKSLQVEFAEQLAEKKEAYAELKKVRDELRDLTVHTANYEELRDLEKREKRKEKSLKKELLAVVSDSEEFCVNLCKTKFNEYHTFQ